jgi:hypothetical protein
LSFWAEPSAIAGADAGVALTSKEGRKVDAVADSLPLGCVLVETKGSCRFDSNVPSPELTIVDFRVLASSGEKAVTEV